MPQKTKLHGMAPTDICVELSKVLLAERRSSRLSTTLALLHRVDVYHSRARHETDRG